MPSIVDQFEQGFYDISKSPKECTIENMNEEIIAFNQNLPDDRKPICELLATEIQKALPKAENKLWHGGPVWFIDGNPIVGYDNLKSSVRLLFWSGADFDEPDLALGSGKFKDAHKDYASAEQVNAEALNRWLEKSEKIQWDYKNIVKRKGVLKRLK